MSLDNAWRVWHPFTWTRTRASTRRSGVDPDDERPARVLDAYDAGTLTEAALEAWADEVYGREDIELDPADRDLLADALFELSTPEINGPMRDIVSGLRRRLH